MTQNLQPILASFKVTAKEVHVYGEKREVLIWASGVPEFRPEAKDGEDKEWEYKGEYIFMLTVNEEGKIVRILEFLDSLGTEKLRGLMGRARKNLRLDGPAF